MDAFLINIVSAVMLPLFLIMILCTIAGAKPEPVVKGLFDVAVALIAGTFKLAMEIAGAGRAASRSTSRRRQPAPQRRRRDDEDSAPRF